MFKTILTVAVFAGLLPAETLSQGERDRAMSYLHATRKQFIDSLAGISEAQWKWKPSPEVWSVAEVAEHIALSEDLIFGRVRQLSTAPASDAELKAKAKGKDDFLMKALVDRSTKAQAPEPLRPSNKWANAKELTAHFKNSRDNTIEFVKTTTADLRSAIAPHPFFKELDAYQWILLIAGHSERHLLQLKEVQATAGYPKK